MLLHSIGPPSRTLLDIVYHLLYHLAYTDTKLYWDTAVKFLQTRLVSYREPPSMQAIAYPWRISQLLNVNYQASQGCKWAGLYPVRKSFVRIFFTGYIYLSLILSYLTLVQLKCEWVNLRHRVSIGWKQKIVCRKLTNYFTFKRKGS